MYNESLSDEELEEVKSLSDIFSDLEPSIVRLIYLQCDRDYRRSQEKLAEVAKDPAAKAQLLLQQLPVSSSFHAPGSGPGHASSSAFYNDDDLSRSQGTRGSGAALSGLAALALAPAPSDAPSNGAYLPTLPSFDVNTLTETLTQVGNSVSDGITSFANNITGWVADLASAFDSGWGDEGEERPPQSDKNEPAVGYGTGVGIDRPYQRRLNSHVSVDRQQSHHRLEAEADPNEEDEWEEGDEGYGKDD